MNENKVIHFVGLFGNLGGTEKATLEEMQMLRNAGYQVIYTCITPMGRFRELLDQEGFPWVSCNYYGPTDWKSFLRIWRRLNSIKSLRNVLVSHNIVAMLCFLLQRKRHVTFMRHHYHHFGKETLPHWKWWLTYAVASISVKNVAFVCNYIRDEAIRIWPRLGTRSCVIYNIFRVQPEVTAEEKYNARRKFGIPDSAFVIGGAGRFESVKRWDVWCDVVEKVFAHDAKSMAILVGSGSMDSIIKDMVGKYPNRFIWPGSIADMSVLYQAIDVLLFVTDFDSTPRVPMEALSFQRPVVAAATNGGLREVFPIQCFPFYSHLEVEELAEKILSRQEWIENNCKREFFRFSPELSLRIYQNWLCI